MLSVYKSSLDELSEVNSAAQIVLLFAANILTMVPHLRRLSFIAHKLGSEKSPEPQKTALSSHSTSELPAKPIPSLLSFPNEIILLVAENLDLKGLNCLIQASRRLSSLLTPNLHRLAVQDCHAGWRIPFPVLHWAAWKGYEGLARLLLDKGFDADLRTTFQGKTALHFAALKGHEAIIRLLLDKGAKADMQDISYGISPLHIAALEGHEAVVRLLLDRGADVSIGDHMGRTALVWAARYASLDKEIVGVFRLLLERGANVDMRERECGGTSLHWAVEKGRREAVKLLLEKGASLTVLSDSKETAVDWALRKGDDEMVSLLLGCGEMDDLAKARGSTIGLATRFKTLPAATRA